MPCSTRRSGGWRRLLAALVADSIMAVAAGPPGTSASQVAAAAAHLAAADVLPERCAGGLRDSLAVGVRPYGSGLSLPLDGRCRARNSSVRRHARTAASG
jgi:hypothetical protein